MSAAARPVTRLGGAYGGSWISCKHAAELLRMYDARPARMPGLPTRRVAPPRGVRGKHVTLYREADIQRLVVLRRECGLTLKQAVRVVVAEIEGRI